MEVEVDREARSNFPSGNAYVVQAWDSSLERWLDTRWGHSSVPLCKQFTIPKVADPKRWIGGKVGKMRIVPRIREAKCYD